MPVSGRFSSSFDRQVTNLAYDVLLAGRDVEVPEELASLVAKQVPELERAVERRRRDERTSLIANGYIRLHQHQASDEPLRRGGFSDVDDEG